MLRDQKPWFVLIVLLCLSSAWGATVMDYPSALELGYQFLFPRPGSEYIAQQTGLIVRFDGADPNTLTNLETFIQVYGSQNGLYTGQTQIATDGVTVLFTPNRVFSRLEQVTVTLTPTWSAPTETVAESMDYTFYVAGPQTSPSPPIRTGTASGMQSLETETQSTVTGQAVAEPVVPHPGQPYIMDNGVSVPSNFPYIVVTTYDDPDPNLIFMDNRTSGSNSFNVIFDNIGQPVWYWQTDDERRDMKVQRNGLLTMLARDGGMRFIGLNDHYQQVAEYKAVQGYTTDEHECVVLEDGSYFLIGTRSQTIDMTRYLSGASSSANVNETTIQGFTPAGEMIFQWRGLDNFDLCDSEPVVYNPRSSNFNFPHMNAIDLDYDGQILLSCRGISEMTKINRDTGEIIWRLGGAHSDFTFINDPLNGPRNQHAIRATDPNRYLLFDNGDGHSPQVSRGVEYELNMDPNVMTASIVWQYPDPTTTSMYAHYMANTQRLPSGNTLINWAVGYLPKLTEIKPDGTKALELNWLNNNEAYRVWKCTWQGRALTPYLIAEPSDDHITLIYNQFGDPNVAFYRIYADTTPQPTTLLLETELTLAELTDLVNSRRYYFRVTAVDVNGLESDFSNEVNEYINFVGSNNPGEELVVNGDFTDGQAGWTWELQGGDATWSIDDGAAHMEIAQGGDQIYSVQLRQAGIPLIQGHSYVFEFDAWAAGSRVIEAKVGQDQSPFTNYSQIGYTALIPQKKHFKYTFTMNESTDTNARVVINTGTSDLDVWLDNISVTMQ